MCGKSTVNFMVIQIRCLQWRGDSLIGDSVGHITIAYKVLWRQLRYFSAALRGTILVYLGLNFYLINDSQGDTMLYRSQDRFAKYFRETAQFKGR